MRGQNDSYAMSSIHYSEEHCEYETISFNENESGITQACITKGCWGVCAWSSNFATRSRGEGSV